MSENFGLSTKKIYHCSRTAFNTFKGNFEGKKIRLRPSFSNVFIQILSCLFEILSKCFQSCCEICILRFQKKTLTSLFCRICCFFSKFEHTFIEVLNVKFHHCPQNNIQHVQRNNWRKKISLLFSKFFSYFWVTSSRSFGKSTFTGLSKLDLTFPGETFRHLFWDTSNFAYFSDLKRKRTAS